MRLATCDGRATLVLYGRYVDLEEASGGRFDADPMHAFERWEELCSWFRKARIRASPKQRKGALGPPVPRPSQVFGIGLNYRAHALEAGMGLPDTPLVFAKFGSSVTGPFGEVVVPTASTDWEAELAVVIGTEAHHVPAQRAWDHVAGVTLAQDFSARDVQMTPANAPQFSLGKSFPGFLPLGPELVTIDELPDRNAVPLWCDVDGRRMQSGCTDDLVFSVPQLIEYLSAILPLRPGDIILTGTPSGVGMSRTPPVFLRPGQVVETGSPWIGRMRHQMVEPKPSPGP